MILRRPAFSFPLWLYFALYAAVICMALTLFAGFAGNSFNKLRKADAEEARLRLLSTVVAAVNALDAENLTDKHCQSLAGETGVKLVVAIDDRTHRCDEGLLQNATMAKLLEDLAEREQGPLDMAGHGDGLHFIAAFLAPNDGKSAKIGIAVTEQTNEEFPRPVLLRLAALGLIVIVFLGILSVLFYRRIARPLHEMRLGAKLYARGRFDRELPQYGISEISDLAREMNKMGGQLKHLEQVRRDFVANVSHELKTPITSIKGFVETLLEGAMEDKEDLLRFLTIISRQGERLTAIIEDLLTLARLESGGHDDLLLLQEHSLEATIEGAVDICRSQAVAKQINLEINCDPKVTAVFDRSLIEQALMNLIDNAIKYSGPKETVTITATRTPNAVILTVNDHGPGIPEEHLPRLFERFYRVDKARSRNQGGTGLGLAIVKHVATIHHGTVSVQSRLDHGSRFTLTLPEKVPGTL